ncbi:ParA family protein [Rhodothermus bifroesti]|uniref:ParA family protein n=1 Tax=Rhodothermus marinus TaxID=29549 RepID=A0A7V2B2T5_RHOMR|nr:ParA family protein [Rhodothermus bifroesti]GBD02688.1 Sporulation initiation inhibitor protein Soj [bacterium HR18]
MITLTICNHKGGTGKTTTAIHVAAALGLSGHRVLVIDLDPQGFLTRVMGIPEPPEEASVLALFNPSLSLQEVQRHRVGGFDLLPSSTGLTRVMRQLNRPTDVFWAKEALAKGGVDYDVVIFDTAAAVTVYSLNALVASQHVLVPVTPEYQPVLGAEQTAQTVHLVREKLNPTLHPPLFLFTQVDARKRTHQLYRRYLSRRYGDRVLETVIRTSASLAQSFEDGSTVFTQDPYSRGARDYANATDELLRRMLQDRAAAVAV